MNLTFKIARKYWQIRHRLARALVGRQPAQAWQLAVIESVWSSPHRPTDYLIDLGLRSASLARTLRLPELEGRGDQNFRYFELYPGEHYKLLAALCLLLSARKAVEIGTLTGMGSLALLCGVPSDGQVHTFDVVNWQRFPDTWLQEEHFSSGRIVQHLDDLSDPRNMTKHLKTFEDADVIFFDGPKDYLTEQKMLENLNQIKFKGRPLLVFDDIHTLGMAHVWSRITQPKFVMTSLGHWTGTGLVDWCG